MNTKRIKSEHLLLGVGILGYFLLRKSPVEKAVKSVVLNGIDGQPFQFNMWKANSYKDLVKNGYSVKLMTSPIVLAEKIRFSGYIVKRDGEILSALRSVGFKTQLNQLATVFTETTIAVISPNPDLFSFIKDGLSSDSMTEICTYLNQLPDGYSK